MLSYSRDYLLLREQYYRSLFSELINHMNDEFKQYSATLSEKLKWFAHLSPKSINSFSLEDAQQIKSLVPGVDDEDLLLAEFNLLKNRIFECETMIQVCDLLKKCDAYPRV